MRFLSRFYTALCQMYFTPGSCRTARFFGAAGIGRRREGALWTPRRFTLESYSTLSCTKKPLNNAALSCIC